MAKSMFQGPKIIHPVFGVLELMFRTDIPRNHGNGWLFVGPLRTWGLGGEITKQSCKVGRP